MRVLCEQPRRTTSGARVMSQLQHAGDANGLSAWAVETFLPMNRWRAFGFGLEHFFTLNDLALARVVAKKHSAISTPILAFMLLGWVSSTAGAPKMA
jgi:hypothetical protein